MPQPTNQSSGPPPGYTEVPAPSGGLPAGYVEVPAPSTTPSTTPGLSEAVSWAKGLAPQPIAGASPAQARAVQGEAGSPLNLGGKGLAGKAQASLWSLRDFLNERDLHNAMTGELTGQQMESPGFKMGSTLAGMGGDVAGLIGQPLASPKNMALTVGAATPGVKAVLAPYFAYQGMKMLADGPKPGEKEADFYQRTLLGGSMLAGATAQVSSSSVETANTMSDFAARARKMKTIDEGFNAIAQGPIKNSIILLQGLLKREVDNPARTLVSEDMRDNTTKGIQGGQINASIAGQAMTDRSTSIRTGANKAIADIQGKLQTNASMTMQQAIDYRSDLGAQMSAARRAGDMHSYSIAADGYGTLTRLIEDRATAIGQKGMFNTYNNNAKALFEHLDGPPGDFLGHMAKAGKEGIDQGLSLLTDKKNQAIWEETADRMDKLGASGDQLRDMIKYSRTLADARQSTIKSYGQSLYKAAMNPSAAALAGFGVYLAMHGAGMYGFAPYLAATMAISTMGPLKSKMEAGKVISREPGLGTKPLLTDVQKTEPPPPAGTASIPGGTVLPPSQYTAADVPALTEKLMPEKAKQLRDARTNRTANARGKLP